MTPTYEGIIVNSTRNEPPNIKKKNLFSRIVDRLKGRTKVQKGQ